MCHIFSTVSSLEGINLIPCVEFNITELKTKP